MTLMMKNTVHFVQKFQLNLMMIRFFLRKFKLIGEILIINFYTLLEVIHLCLYLFFEIQIDG